MIYDVTSERFLVNTTWYSLIKEIAKIGEVDVKEVFSSLKTKGLLPRFEEEEEEEEEPFSFARPFYAVRCEETKLCDECGECPAQEKFKCSNCSNTFCGNMSHNGCWCYQLKRMNEEIDGFDEDEYIAKGVELCFNCAEELY